VSYLDANHVDYYYGVAANEATTLRTAYEGKSAVNTSLGLTLAMPIFFGGFTSLSLNYNWVDSSISDSPLVDSDTSFSLTLIYSRFFR
jgi:outer membrane protein